MNLTRHILLEKVYPFKNYNNPEDIPEYMWQYASSIIGEEGLSNIQAIQLYLDIVIVPLLGCTSCKILPSNLFPFDNSWWIRLEFEEYEHIEIQIMNQKYSEIDNISFLKYVTEDIWNHGCEWWDTDTEE